MKQKLYIMEIMVRHLVIVTCVYTALNIRINWEFTVKKFLTKNRSRERTLLLKNMKYSEL
ncbi:hypothetical protein GLOIN_2v1734494 [Rhizophagus irregularis DAOM 181602=DAOM 197198]|uniref:Uncharacterized protein n=1 Tax=Rhizophagus irregularis (strain DAOM 181602 / DAOM 197198 / MUCL 43194) TaxID=747089 RepID=A0A2P4NXY8_RHIID|nr:hypothetical protein GLOIN_2v1734494 [Rhizophagus irregularis DAOM 181602=DAOM 197198]POG58005.1 hypothetical protein GLOIN_2v1734494 [Rhizophagus irregularis DAOM 181602=DAOM 197198]|eukprot:XP_025164871.1 hypothetical protein GLOIN_2v1734494 [Rhizophagus irregularis DAOM 181602=DAOM 197198]